MKNKKTIVLIAAILIIVLAVFVISKATNDKTEPLSESQSTSDKAEKESTEPELKTEDEKGSFETEPSSKPEQSNEHENATENKIAKIAGRYYYLFDDEKITCTVYCFDENGKVDISFIDEETIYNGDPQYLKGYAKYTCEGDKIYISNLQGNFADIATVFDIKDDGLFYGEEELTTDLEFSLNIVNGHFV